MWLIINLRYNLYNVYVGVNWIGIFIDIYKLYLYVIVWGVY